MPSDEVEGGKNQLATNILIQVLFASYLESPCKGIRPF